MPVHEDKTNPAEWRRQRRSNITMLCATALFMVISLVGRWQEIPTHYQFSSHPFHRFINYVVTGEQFFLEPLGFMWVISLGILMLQRWDLFQPPTHKANKRSRGRPKGPQVQESIGLTKKGLLGLEMFFNGLSRQLSSPQVKSLIKALSHEEIRRIYLAEEYTDAALADWLIERFRANIRKRVTSSATIKTAVIKNDKYEKEYILKLKDIYAEL